MKRLRGREAHCGGGVRIRRSEVRCLRAVGFIPSEIRAENRKFSRSSAGVAHGAASLRLRQFLDKLL